MNTSINCIKCIYYYVTWDSKFPRGCKLFGFKTKTMPSITVFDSTGKPCENFTPKLK
jgi:hypothetical protein